MCRMASSFYETRKHFCILIVNCSCADVPVLRARRMPTAGPDPDTVAGVLHVISTTAQELQYVPDSYQTLLDQPPFVSCTVAGTPCW